MEDEICPKRAISWPSPAMHFYPVMQGNRWLERTVGQRCEQSDANATYARLEKGSGRTWRPWGTSSAVQEGSELTR